MRTASCCQRGSREFGFKFNTCYLFGVFKRHQLTTSVKKNMNGKRGGHDIYKLYIKNNFLQVGLPSLDSKVRGDLQLIAI